MANKQTNTPQPIQIKRWIGGISDYLKENATPDAFYFAVSIDYRKDPQSLTLLPGAKNESGTVVTDLLKWGDIVPDASLNSYYYGDTGNIYRRTNLGVWSLIHTAANSHGNGLAYFTGDQYLYYMTDAGLGRYGQITTQFAFYENWASNSFSSAWFDWGGVQATVSNQLLNISSTTAAGFYGVELSTAYDLTGYAVINQLVSVGIRTLSTYEVYPIYIKIKGDSSNQLFWFIDSSNVLKAFKKVAGSNTAIATGTYDPTVHKYFRIRESLGTIYFDYSTDSTNWFQFASTSNPFAITSVTIGQQVGTSGTEVSPATAILDNFSLAPTTNAAQFADNFLKSQGGTPLNTYSLALVASSSQYATAADSATLSITSDLTLESYVKFNSLPAVGSSMTLLGKWDESGTLRSYKMDILGVSGYFGSGTNGTLTISSNTTQSQIVATSQATAGSTTILATNVSFAAGQIVKIVQTQGTNAGQYERLMIQGYTAGQITTSTPLIGSYGAGSQVIVVPQYTNITINNGFTWSAPAWNGTTGSELVALYSGTCTVNGTISANGLGFRGGTSAGDISGTQGEGTPGLGTTIDYVNNGNGGGGGNDFENRSGAGGGNGTVGGNGQRKGGALPPILGGTTAGSSDLTTMSPGGGGGAAGIGGGHGGTGVAGGIGGGVIDIAGVTFTMGGTGLVTANGTVGAASFENASGSGAGGSVKLSFQIGTIGTNQITALGGIAVSGTSLTGGRGGDGRIVVRYLTSVTGTTNPALVSVQDNSLVTTTSYQLRLGISSTGTNSEFLTTVLPTLSTGVWQRFSIAWQAAKSTASFYGNGGLLATSTGTLTAIHDNASLLYLGANKGASAVQNFLDGETDDNRIWASAQTAAQIAANNNTQVPGTSGTLNAEWLLNNAATDSTANANNLTLVNSPLYTTDVPFPDASTRLDIDLVGANVGGSTYALGSAISEATADMLPFTPLKDPQASMQFIVGTKGTGNWTLTIHDQQNRVVATTLIANANIPLAGGKIEFVFNPPWRIVIGKPYHAHFTSSDATGTVVSSVSNNISTATYTTYFQFLVTDTQFHPVVPFLNFIVIGNERYLATWDGAFYQPNLIAFPAGTKVRCISFWREYIVAGVWRGNNITDYNQGRLYFWDGLSATFNFFIDVPQGQIAAIYGKDSDLYLFAGYRGVLMKYTGSYALDNGGSAATKLKRIPKIGNMDSVDIYPGAITMYRDLIHFGLAANSTGATMTRATYSWGSLNQLYPDTLSCDYPISTGSTGSSVSIGLTYPVGQNLIVGWQDGTSFGADVISFTNPPASSGYIQTLVQDDNALWKDKLNFDVRADTLPLNTGESVQVGISVDRGTFVTGSLESTDTTFTKFTVTTGRAREYQLQATLFATGTTSPTLLALGVLHSDTDSESQW